MWPPPNCKDCGTPMVRASGHQDSDDWHGVCPNDECALEGHRLRVFIPWGSLQHPEYVAGQ